MNCCISNVYNILYTKYFFSNISLAFSLHRTYFQCALILRKNFVKTSHRKWKHPLLILALFRKCGNFTFHNLWHWWPQTPWHILLTSLRIFLYFLVTCFFKIKIILKDKYFPLKSLIFACFYIKCDIRDFYFFPSKNISQIDLRSPQKNVMLNYISLANSTSRIWRTLKTQEIQ